MHLHKWLDLEVTHAMNRRMVLKRRVCFKCGRVEIYKYIGKWMHVRDVDPKQIKVIITEPTLANIKEKEL